MRRRHLLSTLSLTAAWTTGLSAAQGATPITVVVPFAAGASADTTMRLITRQVTKATGQMFIIDNRPGANGIVGAELVKRAAANGQTLFEANVGSHAINVSLYDKRLPYDPHKDFAPITLLWRFPSVLAVPAASPARDVADLIQHAHAKPHGLSYASAGTGSGGHLLGEMFKAQSKAPMLHVPYRGAAPAVVDLMGNQVDFFFVSYSSVAKQVQSGHLRILAVASPQRLSVLPTVPTMGDAGLGEVLLDNWFGLVAPAATPQPALRHLHELFARAARDPEIVAQLAEQGIEAASNTPAEFAALMRADTDKLGRIVKAVGAKAD